MAGVLVPALLLVFAPPSTGALAATGVMAVESPCAAHDAGAHRPDGAAQVGPRCATHQRLPSCICDLCIGVSGIIPPRPALAVPAFGASIAYHDSLREPAAAANDPPALPPPRSSG